MRVERLRTSPIKGLWQQEVESVEFAANGLATDRRFVLVGTNGRVRYGAELDGLANVVAEWDEDAGTLELRLPDGTITRELLDFDETAEVRSTSGARAMEGRVVGGAFAEVLSRLAGEDLELLQVAPGVAAPGQVTVIGDGSLRRVAEAVGVEAVDPARFRMNVELSGLEPHDEDGWEGRSLRIGGAVVKLGDQVPRCVLITRDPSTRTRDLDLLRAILAYRAPMATGEAPLGVYATVVEPGRVSVGDVAELVD